MTGLTVALGDHPHTAALKSRETLAGVPVSFPTVSPIYKAFGEMARSQPYDASEMAIVALLQAREAGAPLLLLPVVIAGNFHHGSIKSSPVNPPSSPADLRGRRVGVRAYSQTTGLWVRGWLEEEYGVAAQDVTWVVTERSHEPSYQDPPNVELTERSLQQELETGGVAAAVPGREVKGFAPIVADAPAADRAWFERHGVVPVNHLVAVTERFAATQPQALSEMYALLTAGIDEAARAHDPGALPSALAYGVERVAPAVELAARYAVRQGLISSAPNLDDVFVTPA